MTNSRKMKLSHILTAQKYEIEDVQRKLKEGVPFETLALQYSKCSSSRQGGSLGNIALSRLDPDFAEAAEILAPGDVSNIVRTRFGYHLIRHDVSS